MLTLSWVSAVVACLGYGTASVLQSVGAQRAARASGVTGFALILLQAPYLGGLALDAVAFGANVVALQRLPLFLVQAILTASVGVTAVIAALRGARLTVRNWACLGVLGLGLVLLGLSADAESAVPVPVAGRYLLLAAGVVPAVLGALGWRSRHGSARILALAAGLFFAGVAVASRGISADGIGWALLADPLAWTIVVHGALGMVFFAVALQRGAVTVVTAVVFMTEMVVPSGVGLAFFGDSVRLGMDAAAVVGFLLAVAGTLALVRFAE